MQIICGRLALTTLVGASVVVASALAPDGRAEDPGAKPMAVLELFTSQGCSACPPADALLARLALREDVMALTLPVDYWDYLGWEDTLATPENTVRQRSYAETRGDNQVYTPQMVVNGMAHAVGKKLPQIQAAMDSTEASLEGQRVSLDLVGDSETLTINIGPAAANSSNSGIVWVMLLQREVTVAIERGENRGKTITYHNVVRRMMPIGKWSGKATTLNLPIRHLLRDETEACAVLLQQGSAGPILAAAECPTT